MNARDPRNAGESYTVVIGDGLSSIPRLPVAGTCASWIPSLGNCRSLRLSITILEPEMVNLWWSVNDWRYSSFSYYYFFFLQIFWNVSRLEEILLILRILFNFGLQDSKCFRYKRYFLLLCYIFRFNITLKMCPIWFWIKIKIFFLWKFTIIYSFFYANMISKYVNRRVLIYLWKIDFRDWRSTKVYLLNYKQLVFVVNEIKSRIVYYVRYAIMYNFTYIDCVKEIHNKKIRKYCVINYILILSLINFNLIVNNTWMYNNLHFYIM